MKYLKMLSLAAVMTAALAFAGVGTASATVMCETPTEACGSPYEGPVAAKLETGTKAKLVTSLGTVECEVSNSSGTVASTGVGLIEKLSFEKCKIGLTACTVTVKNLPYKAVVTASAAGGDVNGTMVVSSDGSGSPGALVECVGVINCTFSKATVSLEALGGAPGKLVANTELERSGGLCPTTSTWEAKYVLTEPPALYVLNS
jgi:hypothetical protein